MTGVLPVFLFFSMQFSSSALSAIRSIPRSEVFPQHQSSVTDRSASVRLLPLRHEPGTDIFTDRKPSSEEDNPNTPINEVIKI